MKTTVPKADPKKCRSFLNLPIESTNKGKLQEDDKMDGRIIFGPQKIQYNFKLSKNLPYLHLTIIDG